jgi:hypothetical protein
MTAQTKHSLTRPTKDEWKKFVDVTKKHSLRLALKNNLKNTSNTLWRTQ